MDASEAVPTAAAVRSRCGGMPPCNTNAIRKSSVSILTSLAKVQRNSNGTVNNMYLLLNY
jgi:hypothetical protein